MNILSRPDRDGTGAQSVDRALGLLSLIGRHADRGAALGDIVETFGLNKATTRRLLLALMRAGMIEQDAGSRRYFLGEEAYVLGSLAARRYGLLRVAIDSLVRMSRKTEDTSFLSVRRDTSSVCLYREEGTYPVRTHALQAGFEHPLGVGAGSLAMLAALPDPEIEGIMAANDAVLKTRYPMLPPERILADIAVTRASGFALNPGLIYANSWGVGMAILNAEGRPVGALSIAAIDGRMQPARQGELATLLGEEVRRVETMLPTVHSRPEANSGSAKARTSTRRLPR